MILTFHIQNFKSIVDLTFNTLYADEDKESLCDENPYHIYLEECQQKVPPILAIYGPNASGKTNIIEAFNIFQKIIFNGLRYNYYTPNKLVQNATDTHFNITFTHNKGIYNYSLTYNEVSIKEEVLTLNNKTLIDCRNQELIKISNDNDFYDVKEIYKIECKDEEQHQRFALLTKLGKNYANLNLDITNAYKYIIDKIDVTTSHFISEPYFGVKNLTNALNKDEKSALTQITSIIKNFDIDIEELEIQHIKVPRDEFPAHVSFYAFDPQENATECIQFFSYHKIKDDKRVRFSINEESYGTQTLISLLGVSLATLTKGGTLILDELDRSIHPTLLTLITRLFKDKRYNTKNAQLICTLHCTDLLEDELTQKSEIAIVSKTKKKGTKITKLSEFEDLEDISDYRKHYLLGDFSGIPQAYI